MRSKKDEKVLELIERLNCLRLHGTDGFFDCGELGIVHIWWGRGGHWEWRWMDVVNAEEFLRG